MIGSLSGWIVEGFSAPRLSARRLLGLEEGRKVAVWLLCLGVILGLFAAKLAEMIMGQSRVALVRDAVTGGEAPAAAEPLSLAVEIETLLASTFQSATFFIFAAALAYFLGRRAGGSATFEQVFLMSGWWSVLWAPAQFVSVLALVAFMPDDSTQGVAFGVLLGIELMMLYLFANMIAEAHGFRSASRVMAAVLALVVCVALVIALVMVSTAGGVG